MIAFATIRSKYACLCSQFVDIRKVFGEIKLSIVILGFRSASHKQMSTPFPIPQNWFNGRSDSGRNGLYLLREISVKIFLKIPIESNFMKSKDIFRISPLPWRCLAWTRWSKRSSTSQMRSQGKNVELSIIFTYWIINQFDKLLHNQERVL